MYIFIFSIFQIRKPRMGEWNVIVLIILIACDQNQCELVKAKWGTWGWYLIHGVARITLSTSFLEQERIKVSNPILFLAPILHTLFYMSTSCFHSDFLPYGWKHGFWKLTASHFHYPRDIEENCLVWATWPLLGHWWRRDQILTLVAFMVSTSLELQFQMENSEPKLFNSGWLVLSLAQLVDDGTGISVCAVLFCSVLKCLPVLPDV